MEEKSLEEQLKEEMRRIYNYLMENQVQLPEDMAKIIQDNLWDLYEE